MDPRAPTVTCNSRIPSDRRRLRQKFIRILIMI
jgi:hypothetical protein